jgi:hypothetical protein
METLMKLTRNRLQHVKRMVDHLNLTLPAASWPSNADGQPLTLEQRLRAARDNAIAGYTQAPPVTWIDRNTRTRADWITNPNPSLIELED